MEERQRLARELHDAVTQTPFSAGIIAKDCPGSGIATRNRGGSAWTSCAS
jgi:signal transduction histidine kinase